MRNATLPRDRVRRAIAWIACAVSAAALLAALGNPTFRPPFLLRDFNAFYCAGVAIDRGADPYRAEPLGACERRSRPPAFAHGTAGLAVPAPLPPYALAPFALVARLPYLWAGAVWSLATVVALGLAAAALCRLSGVPSAAVIAAFALGGYAALCLGQVAPFATAGIALAALFSAQGRERLAAVAAAGAMIEPHVGLPACLALFTWRPATRLPLLVAGLVCLGLSLALVGLPVALEYVRDVLPAHALSEIANEKQLSLTYLLHEAGLADAPALRVGELWYLAMLMLGNAVAGALGKRSPAFVAAVPPAFTLLGGAFVHVVQVAAALPAALLLLATARGTTRRALAFALVALAVPWVQFASLGLVFCVLAPLAAVVLVATLIDVRPWAVGTAALGTFGALTALWSLLGAGPPHAEAALAAAYDPRALAEASWTIYVRTVAATDAAAFDLAKLPTWFGLALVDATAFTFALRLVKKNDLRLATATPREGSGASRRIATR